MKWLLVILILCCLTAQAEIQRLVIDDFSGGINQAAPSQVAPNQCYDMVNFDITPEGALSPRRGFNYLNLAEDSTAGHSIIGLIPYNEIGKKHLLIQRTGWAHYLQILPSGSSSNDSLVDTFFVGNTEHEVWIAANVTSFGPGYVCGWIVDSINAHPTLSTFVTAYDSSGGGSGLGDGVFVVLNAAYEDSVLDVRGWYKHGTQQIINWQWLASNTTNYTKVRSGTEDSVLSQFNALLYAGRSQTGVSSFNYNRDIYIASQGSEMQFFDGDTMAFAQTLCDSQVGAVAIDNSGNDSTLTGRMVRYSQDRGAGPSIASFPVEVYNGVVYVSDLSNQNTTVYRSIDGSNYRNIGIAFGPDFVDSLPANSTDSTDSCNTPGAYCFDSTILFKPSRIIQRGTQAFAIGDPAYPNRIYYSTFYDPDIGLGPTTWVADKFWDIPSNEDDWFVALAVLGDDLYAFRQNSIVRISGFTFYQYQIQTLSHEVGAYAPQSVAAALSHIYFADKSGIYVTNGGEPIKISQPIDSLWENYARRCLLSSDSSYGGDCRRLAIGKIVDGEYWLQTHALDIEVLIFNENLGNWRRYNVQYDVISDYGTDTTTLDWILPEPLIVRNDSLFQRHVLYELDYWDTTSVRSYTSRILFDDPTREKIHYIDLQGVGKLDSILIVNYREGGVVIDTSRISGDSLVWTNADSQRTAPPSERIRFYVGAITPAYQFKMLCYPRQIGSFLNSFAFTITSIVIGWQPWDEGRPR